MSKNWRQDNRPKSSWQKNDYQGKRKHQYKLEPGVAGFLCTCNKYKERESIKDAYNILNEFADQMFGLECTVSKEVEKETGEVAKGNDDDDDIDKSLKDEIASLKSEREVPINKRRFQVVESGANGVVFIKTTVPDPVSLCHKIVSSIADSKVQKSKFIFRMLPVEVVCKANVDDITTAAGPLFQKYFAEGDKTFSIVFSHSNNTKVSRDAVIEALASLVNEKNPTNKVDLKAAQLAILVEVIRGICCISIMPDYYKLKKYNILELCGAQAEKNKESTEGLTEKGQAGGEEKKKEKAGHEASDDGELGDGVEHKVLGPRTLKSEAVGRGESIVGSEADSIRDTENP